MWSENYTVGYFRWRKCREFLTETFVNFVLERLIREGLFSRKFSFFSPKCWLLLRRPLILKGQLIIHKREN